MRTTGTPARVAAVLLAAVLGCASPVTALAQTTDDSTANWAPPPVSVPPPGDGGVKPDKDYQLKTACVTRDKTDNQQLQEKAWAQPYLQLDTAQELVRAKTGGVGRGFRVAVIDTGVTPHPYLNVVGDGDYVHSDNNGLEDCDGHGTEVAGIIAANPPASDNVGFKGVAPDAQIVSIRQTSQNYTFGDQQAPQNGGRQQGDGAGNLTTLAEAVVHAANTPGVSVINMSIDNCRPASGGSLSSQEQQLQAAVHYATVQKNIVVVAAAGNITQSCPQNSQADPNNPTSIVSPPLFADDVLSVAAIQDDGSVAPFSVNGPWVSVAAPGTNITSLDPSIQGAQGKLLANQAVEGGKPGPIQGTSFASPYVAGLAVLVRAMYPTLSARDVMHRIEATAQHPGAPGGHDQYIGYGVINPVAALTAIVPEEEGVSAPPPRQLPPGLPPSSNDDGAPMLVALIGTGGGLAVLFITMFVMHTVRRNRPA